jgi:hypothetical protein
VADDDAHARRHAVHGRGPHRRPVEHDQAAVHLGVLHVDPAAAHPHRGGQVGGGVEAGRQDAVPVGHRQLGVGLAHPVGSVGLQFDQQGVQGGLVGRHHLQAGPAGVGGRAADVDVDHLVVGPGGQDQVQHLGQGQRVDDVALDLDGLPDGHRLTRPPR